MISAVPFTSASTSRGWVVRGSQLPHSVPILERLLQLRCPDTGRERELFLATDAHLRLDSILGDPLTLPDCEAAVERLSFAIETGEHVCVHGDYDADGVTATAILVLGLRALGARVSYLIPHRVHDGFGVHPQSVRRIADDGATLILTADCGSADHEEIQLARSLGVDVIVTDHHTLPANLPDALAIVNPRRPEGSYPYRRLTGAGVAYALLRALVYRMAPRGMRAGDFLQLAAIGTVADVAPMTGENRLLVQAGLRALNQAPLPGLQALIAAAGLAGRRITESDISFKLGPRLNAPGRMADAKLACELLIERDPLEAVRKAVEIEQINRQRRVVTDEMLLQAKSLVEDGNVLAGNLLTVYNEDWSPGLLGIVAAQLCATHGVPVVAATLEAGNVRASVRSVPGANIMAALDECSHLLIEHGGHSQAAGFTVAPRNLPTLHRHLCDAVGVIDQPGMIEVDLELEPMDLSPELSAALERVAPFGPENPEPAFALPDVTPVDVHTFGRSGDHLSLRVPSGSRRGVEVIGFGKAAMSQLLRPGRPAHLIVRPLRERDGSFYPLRFSLEQIIEP